MTRSTERALIKSAQKYHAAPCTITVNTNDEPRRYSVALDPWDNPERAARELARSQSTLRRTH